MGLLTDTGLNIGRMSMEELFQFHITIQKLDIAQFKMDSRVNFMKMI